MTSEVNDDFIGGLGGFWGWVEGLGWDVMRTFLGWGEITNFG